MAEYKPQTAEEHFALQKSTRATETAKAVAEAHLKGQELNRATNERFYNSLAIFSSGTIALSVTFLGYLKTQSRQVQHLHWLTACWVSLMACATSSLFWQFIYGYYIHYSYEREYAEALKEMYEADAEVFPKLTRNALDIQTKSPFTAEERAAFTSSRLEDAKVSGNRAKDAGRKENLYLICWRWLGCIAHITFLLGLGLLLAFAIRNM